MALYLCLIALTLTIVFLVNMTLSLLAVVPYSIMYSFLATIIYFIFVFSLDIIFSLATRWNKRSLFNPFYTIYKVSRKEDSFYRFLKINSWKDKIPEMGKLANFPKTKLTSMDKQYIYKFAEETVYAEVMHYFMALGGLLILFIPNGYYICSFALPIAIVNFILQFPPIFVQRFNRPKLLKIYNRLNK